MSGGIDWFRWHHGSVADQKFQLVAKRAGASVAEVIAVWACLLEAASMSDDRGHPGEPDFESMDCALGLDDGKAERIYSRMCDRGLFTKDGRITAWDKRQPKRERDDDSSTDRVRAFRGRQRQEQPSNASETPCNAKERQGTPRVEESREDKEQQHQGDSAHGSVEPCPVQQIVDLYHACLPENPKVKVLNDARKGAIRQRWREAAKLTCKPFGYETTEGGLTAWRAFFEVCSQSDFLTGKAKALPGKPPFVADLDFLVAPSSFAKCLENKYHREP